MRPVIFDLEGTLVDFQWDLETGERLAVEALTDLGFSPSTLSGLSYAELLNTAVEQAADYGLDEETVRDRIDAVYDTCDADALERWTLRAGAAEIVARIPQRGLVTNVGRTATETLLDRHGFSFDVVVTRDDVHRVKPDPEGLRRAADCLGNDPLFVGDSLTDVRAGRAAGLAVAVVVGGESPSETLQAAEPAHLLHRLDDVLDVVTDPT